MKLVHKAFLHVNYMIDLSHNLEIDFTDNMIHVCTDLKQLYDDGK